MAKTPPNNINGPARDSEQVQFENGHGKRHVGRGAKDLQLLEEMPSNRRARGSDEPRQKSEQLVQPRDVFSPEPCAYTWPDKGEPSFPAYTLFC